MLDYTKNQGALREKRQTPFNNDGASYNISRGRGNDVEH
jgi:hypothetical protein